MYMPKILKISFALNTVTALWIIVGRCVPYLSVYKPHFWQEFTLQNWDAAYTRNIVVFGDWVRDAGIYVVKLPVETASAWDYFLASYCTRANAPTYYRCIGIFWLHESSRQHRFPEDRDITDKLPQMLLATTKVPRMQSQIFYFHTGKI
jgi:hypothetical protein